MPDMFLRKKFETTTGKSAWRRGYRVLHGSNGSPSAGPKYARTVQCSQHHPVFINEPVESGSHTGLDALGAIGKD